MIALGHIFGMWGANGGGCFQYKNYSMEHRAMHA